MTVTQSSEKMIAKWDTFDIGSYAGVSFLQRNANSVALNRIYDGDPSQILGTILSNGKIFLLNPNGIVFGKGSQLFVGGLVASSLNISDEDFLSSKYVFSNNGSAGSVINQGNISVRQGSVVALIGPSVTNAGTITATSGDVVLAAGNQVTLNFNGNSLLGYTVDKGVVDALAENKGFIKADGGRVVMTAKAADSFTKAVVNNSGVIEARTLMNKDGRILLLSDNEYGQTIVDGKLDASAPNGGNGGLIETSGASVKIKDTAKITTAAPKGETGTWLIDPYDFTIAPSGGDVTGDAITAGLANNDVTIRTRARSATCTNVPGGCGPGYSGGNGDIFVNDSINWSSNRTLTLNAYRNIEINQTLTVTGSGTAKLALLYGQGTTGSYTINAPINLPAGDNFSTKNGNANAITYRVITTLGDWNSNTGNDLQGMQGNLGRNYALGADIDASDTSNWTNGFTPVGNFRNNDPNGTANYYQGTFDGLGHTISNLYINRPTTYSVGLFGMTMPTGTYSILNVGLVNVNVTGRDYVGGLAGRTGGIVTNVYATGNVSGAGTTYGQVGGLIGRNRGTVTKAYANVNVTSLGDNVGGLIGWSDNGNVTNVYATGNVSGDQYVGGLVGYVSTNTVSNSYATGSVTGRLNVGGFAGYNSGTISNSYWDTITSGTYTGIGGGTTTDATGRTTAQMMQTENFNVSWDFTNTWWLSAGNTRPFLQMEYMTTITNAHQLQLMAMDLTKSYTLGANINMSELTNPSGLWGTQDATFITGITTQFVPVGNSTTKFTGTFNGQNYTITNLAINRPTTDYVGLFGYIGSAGAVSNVGLDGGSVIGQNNVGSLAGFNEGTITKGSATGSVNGDYEVGGLVGFNAGTITRSSATGAVTGTYDDVGGLVGGNYGTISNSYAQGSVTGVSDSYYVGGLVGYHTNGTVNAINTSYAKGRVSGSAGSRDVGGLIGGGSGSTSSNSFWDTQTTGQSLSAGGTGKTTALMKTASTYTGWDTTNIWTITNGSYPSLK